MPQRDHRQTQREIDATRRRGSSSLHETLVSRTIVIPVVEPLRLLELERAPVETPPRLQCVREGRFEPESIRTRCPTHFDLAIRTGERSTDRRRPGLRGTEARRNDAWKKRHAVFRRLGAPA